VHEEHPFPRVSEGLVTQVLDVYGYLKARHVHPIRHWYTCDILWWGRRHIFPEHSTGGSRL